MVPLVTHPVWGELITGKRQVPPSKVAVNMLIANVRLSYKYDPTETSKHKLAQRMHDFFQKYEKLYQVELEQILERGTHA